LENLPEDVESNYSCYLSKAIRFGDYSLTNIQKEIRDGNIQASSLLQSIFTDSYFYRSVFGEMSIIISFINFKNGTMACMISTTDYPRTIRNLIEENKGDPKLAFPKKNEQFLDSWNRIEFEKNPLVARAQEGIHLA
jgi:hypothetical protein